MNELFEYPFINELFENWLDPEAKERIITLRLIGKLKNHESLEPLDPDFIFHEMVNIDQPQSNAIARLEFRVPIADFIDQASIALAKEWSNLERLPKYNGIDDWKRTTLKEETVIKLWSYISYNYQEKIFTNTENPKITFDIKDNDIFLALFDALITSESKKLTIEIIGGIELIAKDKRKWRKKWGYIGERWDWEEYLRTKSKSIVDIVHRKLDLVSKRTMFITFRNKKLELIYMD